uniref:Uncharacterized protein n=1 Tax=Anguilla anguilla TaxID=7936 RepID=A0A0E9XU51_ANGAN
MGLSVLVITAGCHFTHTHTYSIIRT